MIAFSFGGEKTRAPLDAWMKLSLPTFFPRIVIFFPPSIIQRLRAFISTHIHERP